MKLLPSKATIVKNKVSFHDYRDGVMQYKVTVDGDDFLFPVPLTEIDKDTNKLILSKDTVGVSFVREEKGIFFMRWIRKAIDSGEFISLSPEYYSQETEMVKNELGKTDVVQDNVVIGSQG